MDHTIILPDENATIDLGRSIASVVIPGLLIQLEGELGAGKTALCRGIVTGLGGDAKQVTSPTFTLVNEYVAGNFVVQHCDFTRLERGDLLDDFGGMEFFATDAVFVTEWLSRLGFSEKMFKNQILKIKLDYFTSGRKAELSASDPKLLQFLK